MVIADGLFAFWSEPVIIGVFRRLTDHFAAGELAFERLRTIGWFSRLAVKLAPQQDVRQCRRQWGYAGFKDAHQPETWNPQMKLVEEASLPITGGRPVSELASVGYQGIRQVRDVRPQGTNLALPVLARPGGTGRRRRMCGCGVWCAMTAENLPKSRPGHTVDALNAHSWRQIGAASNRPATRAEQRLRSPISAGEASPAATDPAPGW